jgi:tRNA pseudouridine55 synthase
LQDALPRFTGAIVQQPPTYSALKIGGRRAYQLARRGESVSLEARQVTIHRLQIVRYAYPELEIDVTCGSGTYLRALGRDLARAVGTEAIMSALTRTAVGHLTLDTAVPREQLEPHTWRQHVLPASEAVRDLPWASVTADQLRELAYGREIHLPGCQAEEVTAIMPGGELAAVLTRVTADRYRPRLNFLVL